MNATTNLSGIKILSESAYEELSSPSDTDLHFVELPNTLWDGQWVTSNIQIVSTSGTKNGVQYSLADYLPNDDYNYMVKFTLSGYDNDSAYGYHICTDLAQFTNSTSTSTSIPDIMVCGNTESRQNQNTLDLPVGQGRYIELYGSGGDNIFVNALGYRRLGTNN